MRHRRKPSNNCKARTRFHTMNGNVSGMLFIEGWNSQTCRRGSWRSGQAPKLLLPSHYLNFLLHRFRILWNVKISWAFKYIYIYIYIYIPLSCLGSTFWNASWRIQACSRCTLKLSTSSQVLRLIWVVCENWTCNTLFAIHEAIKETGKGYFRWASARSTRAQVWPEMVGWEGRGMLGTQVDFEIFDEDLLPSVFQIWGQKGRAHPQALLLLLSFISTSRWPCNSSINTKPVEPGRIPTTPRSASIKCSIRSKMFELTKRPQDIRC